MKQLLLSWLRNDEVDDKMIYKNAAERQEIFIRDDVGASLLEVPVFVISEHRSKSITLPVYGFTMRNGIKVICRDNFYDWKVSVQLSKCREYGDIVVPRDLVSDGYRKEISNCYFEGFKNEWVFPAFNPDDDKQLKFSVEVSDDYRLYALLYNLKHLFMDKYFDTNNITVDEVKDSIIKLYDKFFVDDYNLDGGELFFETYHHLIDYDFRKEHNIEKTPWDAYKNAEDFAEQIVKYPEILNEFFMEKHLLEMEY